MIDVVIPARNEATTIKHITFVFRHHPRINRVIVVVDADTTDATTFEASNYATHVTLGPRGKGQCVKHGLQFVRTARVIFCDADLTGLTYNHVSQLTDTGLRDSMVIGVPDFPDVTKIPPRFADTITWAWPWVSGQRRVPTDLAYSLDLHGYLMEVQLNKANHKAGNKVQLERLYGLHSPLALTSQRLDEMNRDHKWGVENGILPER